MHCSLCFLKPFPTLSVHCQAEDIYYSYYLQEGTGRNCLIRVVNETRIFPVGFWIISMSGCSGSAFQRKDRMELSMEWVKWHWRCSPSTCSPAGHNTAPRTGPKTPGGQGRQSLKGNPDIRPLSDQNIALRCRSPLSVIPGHKGMKNDWHWDHTQYCQSC